MWVYQVIIPIKKSVSFVPVPCVSRERIAGEKSRDRKKNKWGLGTVALTGPQRVNVRAREDEGNRPFLVIRRPY